MANFIDADFSQLMLLPASIEDWVPARHPARFIRTFVDVVEGGGELELTWCEGEEGRPAYAPQLLLRVWLYGYYCGIRSSRGLERACREQLPFIWLCGTHQPDHNTLWRFFTRNKKALRSLFGKTLRVALKSDFIGFVLHALDGTRIQTQSATRSGVHTTVLEARLIKLEERIAQLESEVERAGAGGRDIPLELPQALQTAQQAHETVTKALAELNDNHVKHVHPREPEAKILHVKDRGKNLFGYNGQAVADEQSGMIVAQDVVTDENDVDQLVPMLTQARENLGTGAELTVADKGYAKGPSLQEAQERQLNACVILPEHFAARPDDPYHSSHFVYDHEQNTVTCPEGQQLPYWKQRGTKNGYTVKVFRCQCNDCPVRDACTKNKSGREIEIAPHHQALTAQRTYQSDERSQAAMRKRKHIIEPVFAHIKEHMRFRRWTLRGLEGVRTQWSMICTAYNLRKLYALWAVGTLQWSH